MPYFLRTILFCSLITRIYCCPSSRFAMDDNASSLLTKMIQSPRVNIQNNEKIALEVVDALCRQYPWICRSSNLANTAQT
ncbi:Olfactory receptor [Dirofilaria immitis]